MATDPGWIPALGNFWRVMLPGRRRRKWMQEMPILVLLRTITFVGPASWLLFLVVLVLARNPDLREHSATLAALVVTALGVVDVVAIVILRQRPPGGSDAISVARTFSARFFLGWALSEMPVLVGLVFALRGTKLTAYLIGAIFSLIAVTINAPTRSRIETMQAQLRERHVDVGLLDALMLPNGQISPGARR